MERPGKQESAVTQAVRVVLLNVTFWTAAALVTAVGLVVGTPIVTGVGLVCGHRRGLWTLRRAISCYGAVIIRCGWPWARVQFVDHAPGDKPPFVFVANHRSSSDPFLMACLPFECIQVLNNWPARLPVLGFVARVAGYLKVRQMPVEEFIAAGAKLLGEGCSIIAFPEGTRSGSTRMGPFHGAVFRLAQREEAKIVPLAISGNEEIPRRGSLVLRPGRIVVAKLPAISAEQYAGMTPYKLKMWVHGIIERQLEDPAAGSGS
jgi:1-acyl-sn-glycerol-3-phosphate acyltransferase